MSTAIEAEYARQRATGVADAVRELRKAGKVYASMIVLSAFPEAAFYVPFGSRDGEPVLPSKHLYRYNDGMAHYWRPGNYGAADCSWMVPGA